jgi:hypothetical protein
MSLIGRILHLLEIWRTWGQADRFDASRSQGVTERVGEAWISIVKEETFPSQASINRTRELATALDHPDTVRLGEDTGNLHPSRRQVDHEQDREARQPSGGPEFDREEIRGRQDASMRVQDLLPSRPLLPLRRGFNPVLPQDVGDGPLG